MNYTYLPSSPYSNSPTIIMTTNPSSKKTLNLISNPHVSLLVHDWVSHRPPTSNRRGSSDRTGSPPPEASRSSLAALLVDLNTSAMSSISSTINGDARLVDRDTEEERYYYREHLANNTFSEIGSETMSARAREEPDGGRGIFIEGEEVRVVAVKIKDGRVSDWKGAIRDWSLLDAGDVENGAPLVNGVREA
jgi:hypothetical protein